MMDEDGKDEDEDASTPVAMNQRLPGTSWVTVEELERNHIHKSVISLDL